VFFLRFGGGWSIIRLYRSWYSPEIFEIDAQKRRLGMELVASSRQLAARILKLTDCQFEKAKGPRPRVKGRSKTKSQRSQG